MKRYLLALCTVVPLLVSAQMKVVPGSFRNSSASTQSAAGNSLGLTNMAPHSIDWPLDADGNEEVALLTVTFENFPPQEIANVVPSLSHGEIVVKKEVGRTDDGELYLKIFIPARRNLDVTLRHPLYGSDRIGARNYATHNMYRVKVRNDKTLPISVVSLPSGANVILDGKSMGRTPCSIPSVSLGEHHIVVQSPDAELYTSIDADIDVSDAQAIFSYDLRKNFTVMFDVMPGNAEIRIFKGTTPVNADIRRQSDLYVTSLPADEYTIVASLGNTVSRTAITVNAETSGAPFDIRVVEQRAVTICATRFNRDCPGAKITIDGVQVGTTSPCEVMLDYGTHLVQVAAENVTKSQEITVGRNSPALYSIALPGYGGVFARYYQKRQWGITAMYVSRSYRVSSHGSSRSFSLWGDEGSSQGVQLGIAYQPYFGYGQGLSTGIFWQGFFGETEPYANASDRGYYQEHSIYIPLQYQFRLPLSSRVSIGVNGGIAANIGVSNTIKIDGSRLDIGYGHNSEYDMDMPNRVQLSLPLGAFLQLGALQIEAKYSIGITNNEDMANSFVGNDGNPMTGTRVKAYSWSVGASLLF